MTPKQTFVLATVMATLQLQAGGWNDPKDIAQGQRLFAKNCAVCHGPSGIGPQNPLLKIKRKDGKRQPPALDGTTHTSHHSPGKLLRSIALGGKSYGKKYAGWMPGFAKTLTKAERENILKYLHAHWPEKTRRAYDKRFGISMATTGKFVWKQHRMKHKKGH